MDYQATGWSEYNQEILESIERRMPSEADIGTQPFADMKWLIEKIHELLAEPLRG